MGDRRAPFTSGPPLSVQVAPPTSLFDVWPISVTSLFIKAKFLPFLAGQGLSSIFSVPAYREPQPTVSEVEGGQRDDYSVFWLPRLVPAMHVFPLGSRMSAISSDIYARFVKWGQGRNFWVGCFPAKTGLASTLHLTCSSLLLATFQNVYTSLPHPLLAHARQAIPDPTWRQFAKNFGNL